MLRVSNIKMPLPGGDERCAIAKKLGAHEDDIISFVLVRRSIDARDKKNIFYIFSFDVEVRDEEKYLDKAVKCESFTSKKPKEWDKNHRPVVVGSGPCGLFAALTLAMRGAAPIVIERGECAEKRTKTVEAFWKNGKLDPDSNVQFGEGGAGTFSDGKLNTGTRDARQRMVLDEMVKAGAPPEILFDAKPHVGTDRLSEVVSNIRKKIISLGGVFYFNCKMTDIVIKNSAVCAVKTTMGEIETGSLVLAIGHSARDSFEMMREKGIPMEKKPFSAGFRIEHLRRDIDSAQYGAAAALLPAADYKLSCKDASGRGVYTFCMCPGGVVVAAASEEGGVAVNGMSYFARDGVNSNSAVLVSVYPEDFSSPDPLAGMYFQRDAERRAYIAGGGNYAAPAQSVGGFIDGKNVPLSRVLPSYRPGVSICDMRKIYPSFITRGVSDGIRAFGRRIRGFDSADSVLTGVETRSSSPVRIIRVENFSSKIKGLYPCGEGAGYAGGIMSAAVDGIRVAENI